MTRAFSVAPETFVIPESVPVPGVGRMAVNAMVIRGEQPMLLDTLATVHRESYLDEVFKIVEPEDVRWLFLSHEDRDHSGSIAQVLEMCPNAKLITNFLGLGKLSEEFSVPPDRVHLMNDGDRLDIGDRVVTALRPPLFDSSATAGLWDPLTEVYFAADCFGTVNAQTHQYTDELSESDYEEGFYWMNRVNHIWFEHIREEAIGAAADRIKALDSKIIVSGHGPVERKNTARMCERIKRIAGMTPIHLPNQVEFEAMLR
ncbi:MAG: oxygen-binding di-iron domain-containing protein, partial [Rhodobacterales bacterium]